MIVFLGVQRSRVLAEVKSAGISCIQSGVHKKLYMDIKHLCNLGELKTLWNQAA